MSEREPNVPDGSYGSYGSYGSDGSDEQPPRWLAGWVVPGAAPEFRDQLRQAFVAGEFEGVQEGDEALSIPGLEAELAVHLDQFDAPPAREEFVASLRTTFVSGPGASRIGRVQRRSGSVPNGARSLSLRWRLAGGGLLAAAAVWIFLLRPTALNPEPDAGTPVVALASRAAWRAVAGSEGVSVDGVSLAGLDGPQIDALLGAGRVIATGNRAAQLVMGEYFVLELDANTQIELIESELLGEAIAEPGSGGSAGSRGFLLRSDRGAMRVATGPAFPGSRMTIAAPYMEVDVVGTVFGVDVFEGKATCLCCAEGVVSTRPLDAKQPCQQIEAGSSSLVGPGFANKQVIAEHHVEKLQNLALYWN